MKRTSAAALLPALMLIAVLAVSSAFAEDPPNPPSGLAATASDGKITVTWQAPASDEPTASGYRILIKRILSDQERSALDAKAIKVRDAATAAGDSVEKAKQAYDAEMAKQLNDLWAVEPTEAAASSTAVTSISFAPPVAEGTWEISVIAIGPDGSEAFAGEPVSVAMQAAAAPASAPSPAASQPKLPWHQRLFDRDTTWLAILVALLSAAVLVCIQLARSGVTMWIRRIAALEAVDEAVGRTTEMGRTVLFVPGVQDMDDIGTIAGVSILGRVAKTAALYGADLEVPTSKSLVMTACRETVQASYYEAGRPDAYNADRIPYITDDQFGYVAYLVGDIVRTKPAACIYMGAFFAESLLLAETGNAIGAIQIAGTRESAQLPFFVAACDYTLIGEEFFAASAYLSREPDQLGSLKGQDVCKLLLYLIIVVGVGMATVASITDSPGLWNQVNYLIQDILH